MNESENGRVTQNEVEEISIGVGDLPRVLQLCHAAQVLSISNQLEGMRTDITRRLQSLTGVTAQAKADYQRIRFELLPSYGIGFDDQVSFDLTREKIVVSRRK